MSLIARIRPHEAALFRPPTLKYIYIDLVTVDKMRGKVATNSR